MLKPTSYILQRDGYHGKGVDFIINTVFNFHKTVIQQK